ncbi:uncharacterized protein LOC126744412 isoform X3 [Anthonomus grandis grandis]|uniref:uncharacterized protein LOC126744412 isoform X3 n=1 Tax=Anthonomus grandis grandis TaxID=2921223 RepID=UPI00216604E7|nr:uncharacterized protein LOC126744412 isoform X3 [Anthonomus grandis grandis]
MCLVKVVSKRKFWNPKKWFRKKQKTSDDHVVHSHQEQRETEGPRSRSTEELSTDEEPVRSHDVRNSTSMHPGLSVSHDSVFHPLNSGSSDLELDGAQSSSSLSMSQPLGDPKLQTELSSRLRLRRGRGDTSEDDEGLPRSPPCGSPAAVNDPFLILDKTVNNKDLPTKSHSTCSDGSLLSMDSSEMDEDSVGLQSRHSSKVSLNEKRVDQESDLELSFSTVPLNHSAAHHRVSVRPKRTYGAPRRKKGPSTSALPATPEVNEDSSVRSISPESVITEPITELYSYSARARVQQRGVVPHEVKLKCNSLPVGATPPTADSLRLSRSKSNAGKSQDDASVRGGEEREEKLSLFERLFPRRSGRKKKREERISRMEVDAGGVPSEDNKTVQLHATTTSSKVFTETKTVTSQSKREEIKPTVAPRTGAASRQRVQPIDIPVTPKEGRHLVSPVPAERSFSPGTSPIQLELENLLRQRHKTSAQSTENTTKTTVVSSSEYASSFSSSRTRYTETKVSSEDVRGKMKLAGLSPLQQRVLSHDFVEENDCSSRPCRPLAKSHSFKNPKVDKPLEIKEEPSKAASLDSVKNLEEPVVLKSELKLTLKPVKRDKEPAKITHKEQTVLIDESEPKITDSPVFSEANSITISGPSHTAIVNVTTNKSDEFSSSCETEVTDSDGSRMLSVKESQVSVTKIRLHHEVTQVTKTNVAVEKPTNVPEFLNKQLNKVETKPTSNVVFTMKSPKISPEEVQSNLRPKTLFSFPVGGDLNKPLLPRKFSKEDVEIIENKDASPPKTPPVVTTPTTPTQFRFKKNDSKPSSRKSSLISITPESPPIKETFRDKALKTRSMSLDSLKSDEKPEVSIAEEKSGPTEAVVLRRKSFAKQKNDEEPELMKVFARRSLKLRDSDVEDLQEAISEDTKQRDSDKENNTETTPEPEKKIISPKEDRTMGLKSATKEDPIKVQKPPLSENHKSPEFVRNVTKDEPEVQLRRGLNNNLFLASQRAASLNTPKTVITDFHIKKQSSLHERRKTDQWVTVTKENQSDPEIITSSISTKTDEVRTETKNFSQRRAEWEKRVQQAQK